jgi:hypothetical protein
VNIIIIIGVTEIRRNHKYTRLISRRYGSDQILQNIPYKHSDITKNNKESIQKSPKLSTNSLMNMVNRTLIDTSNPLLTVGLEVTSTYKDSEGVCEFNLEELEILISPSAGWIVALGLFFAWPADLEFWYEWT